MLKVPKILVVGSFMMDLIATTERAPKAGETVKGLRFQSAPGGKGANQAVQCARLGADVTMVGCVGDDAFGKIMLRTVHDSGADVSHVITDPTEASGVGHITVEVVGNSAQNRITICPGANMNLRKEQIGWLESEIGNYDAVLLQFEIPMEINETVAHWAKQAGTMVMVNPAPAAPISDDLMLNATFFSPNELELETLSGCGLDLQAGIDLGKIRKAADVLFEKGLNRLLITLGDKGSVLLENGDILMTDCVKMPFVKDPTAAGDSFVAAFCTGLTAGLSRREAMEFASHTAAITVSRMGAMPSLPTIEEVIALIRERKGSFHMDALDILNSGRNLKNAES
jgi:ribokinase